MFPSGTAVLLPLFIRTTVSALSGETFTEGVSGLWCGFIEGFGVLPGVRGEIEGFRGMTMHFTIRDMRDDDWERVSQIYEQALQEGISTFATVCPTFEEWDKAHLKDCRYVMLADDTVIGWCAVSPTSSREAYKGVVEVSIYFDKAFRGLGLGTKLLDHLCRESEAKGYWCLFVNILLINTASINLHKKCGFREVGYRERIAKDLFGVWQNTVVMERRNGIS